MVACKCTQCNNVFDSAEDLSVLENDDKTFAKLGCGVCKTDAFLLDDADTNEEE